MPTTEKFLPKLGRIINSSFVGVGDLLGDVSIPFDQIFDKNKKLLATACSFYLGVRRFGKFAAIN